MADWTVGGRSFRTRTEYEAAKREAEYIQQIKRRYDLSNKDGIQQLLNDLKAGKYRLRTIIATDFEEELQDRLERFDKGTKGAATAGDGKKSKKKTTGGQGKKKLSLDDYDKDMQKIILAEMKKHEQKRKMLLVSCVFVAILCFGYLGYYYYEAHQTDKSYNELAQLKDKEPISNTTGPTVVINYDEEKEIVIPEVLDEYKNLYNKNKRLIGWIKIADTNIDYPVMQTVDNQYYLKHNFDHEYDKNGCIFLDKDCNVIERSTNLIVYGHHMNSGKMFGKLDKYSSEEYYKKHQYIQFDTIYEKGTYEVMYVFRSKIYEEDDIVFKYYQFIDVNSETEFNSNMNEMAKMSLYDTGVTAKYGDELLTLSTCDYYTDYGRFVVVAKKVK